MGILVEELSKKQYEETRQLIRAEIEPLMTQITDRNKSAGERDKEIFRRFEQMNLDSATIRQKQMFHESQTSRMLEELKKINESVNSLKVKNGTIAGIIGFTSGIVAFIADKWMIK